MTFYEYFRDRDDQQVLFIDGKDLSYFDHFHKSLEIFFCADNSIDFMLGSKNYTIKEGEAFFISSGLQHSIDDHSTKNFCVLIPPSYLDFYFQTVRSFHPVDPIIRGDGAAELGSVIAETKDVLLSGNRLLLVAQIYKILAICVEKLEFGQSEQKEAHNYDLTSRITTYIEENFKEKITLDILSKKFGYNKFYLSELLHSELKADLRDYVNRIRLEKFLQQYTDDIAIDKQLYSCGFTSRQTFYRAFNKIYHMPPAEYLATRRG